MADAIRKRGELATWIDGFHQAAGTATPKIGEALGRLKEAECLVIVTAHQPNLFPYNGVIRKATLVHVIAEELSKTSGLPTVSIFALADQDFTDDRWVKSALIPDVEMREGALQLRASLPLKIMLNSVAKPSEETLENWRRDIEGWMHRKLKSIQRSCDSFGIRLGDSLECYTNFREFWTMVQDAHQRANSYADFNAFVLSMIANHAMEYDTLFCRFSETQRIFNQEFSFLLSRFHEYSQSVKETIRLWGSQAGSVSEVEENMIPFWYHCDCGSKARVTVLSSLPLVGRGECVKCGEEYEIDLHSDTAFDVSSIADRISARAIAMPMVFLNGLKACCYVGGVGGKEYLYQARYVAEAIGIALPPTVTWRPHDYYLGLGQVEALLTYRTLSGTFDLSHCGELKAELQERILQNQKQIAELEDQKVAACAQFKGEEKVARVKAIGAKQDDLRKRYGLSRLARNLGLLENVESIMSMHPSIIDYVVNVGLKETSAQWISFLIKNGNLSSDLSLRTDLTPFEERIRSLNEIG
jgi:hypothetical protein